MLILYFDVLRSVALPDKTVKNTNKKIPNFKKNKMKTNFSGFVNDPLPDIMF
jgi:hypothetical protein